VKRTGIRLRDRLPALGVLVAALTLCAMGPAHAADDATIDHSEVSGNTVKLLVTVPGQDEVDLSSVAVTVDGADAESTATLAGNSNDVRRTTMLAIDTSGSMSGERITAAKAAAITYLDSVPTNVQIGIVTFNNEVHVVQEPSLDRDRSKTLINGLKVRSNTSLYQGVLAAIKATGAVEGQRQVLVLSDGEDTTSSTLPPVIDAIKKDKIRLDVVSLEQDASATADLTQMAEAGNGTVFSADAATLEQTFSDEAQALARQVVVTATVPAGQSARDATVAVDIDAGSQHYSASAFVAVKSSSAPTGDPNAQVLGNSADSTFNIPRPVMYGALGAIALGVIGLVIALASGGDRKDKKTSLEDQFALYSASAETSDRSRAQIRVQQKQSSSLADQARDAAEKALSSNRNFEARIADRLEGAGVALKSSEWLLMHLGIAFASGMFGLLLGAGNPVPGLLLFVLGAVGPWIYLGMKRSRRLKAFDSGLADTLQLMSGSLSAGLSLAQSLDTIVREGVEPITSEFKRVIVESRLGVPLEDALDGVAQRMKSKDFTWVVMAIRIQREVGGNLAELLNTVAATLREREYLRRHVRALSAEGRLSCWILGGLPPAFLLYLTLTKYDYVSVMYTTAIGLVMLVGMVVLLVVGIFWMSKVSKVEI
jgi:tight adherence protein B